MVNLFVPERGKLLIPSVLELFSSLKEKKRVMIKKQHFPFLKTWVARVAWQWICKAKRRTLAKERAGVCVKRQAWGEV